jgi:DNA-binding XRE family transcriptional regulator
MADGTENVADLDIQDTSFLASPGTTGANLEAWRMRHGFTQEMLRLALQVGSRQTTISWEKSTKRLPPFRNPHLERTAGNKICIDSKVRPQRLWPIRNTLPEIGDHGTATLRRCFRFA